MLALSDDILLKIDKPARYIGHEYNSVIKDKTDGMIRFCMCFPDLYEIGMSHLGIQILYDMFNSWDDVWCERVYSPWIDLTDIMRREDIPLFALESQEPVKNFDFLGITLQYEMCYTNVLQVLDLAKIPLYGADRVDDDPIVIGGGPCAYNPEPLAEFFDIFYIGEGETSYRALLDLYKECRHDNYSRKDFLKRASHIDGIYVPSLYNVSYDDDGLIERFEPCCEEVPATIKKQVVSSLDDTYYPTKPIVPFIKATQDRCVLEIQRGCIRGCRFCQAGMIYRPIRYKSLDKLFELTDKMLSSTGYDELSLSSLSSSDYPYLKEFTYGIIEKYKDEHINISLPSLRVDAFSLDVMSKVQDIRKSSLTFAPEAGSQRMRDVINKGLTVDDILGGCREAFLGGWSRVKLYFMLGLPGETQEDMEGIATLSNEIAKLYYELIPKEQRVGRVQIVASTSFFVPKPFTPFQWAPMAKKEDFDNKAHFVNDCMKKQLNYKSIKYNWHASDESVLEGVFARGDRRLSKVIYDAYSNGALFDAWTETFKLEPWMKAFEENNIDPYFYSARERKRDEILPWDHIDIGVTKEFLYSEWTKSKEARITPNCKQHCSGCGAYVYEGGICHEGKN